MFFYFGKYVSFYPGFLDSPSVVFGEQSNSLEAFGGILERPNPLAPEKAEATQKRRLEASDLRSEDCGTLVSNSVLATSSNGLQPTSFLLLVAMASLVEMASTLVATASTLE